MNKKVARLRRATRGRKKIMELQAERLVVNRTPRHIYAQVLSNDGGKVIASASTVDKSVRKEVKYSGNVDAAEAVGTLVAERALEAGVTKVAFDRSGYKYHGRVKALAEAARAKGLQF
ncbi:MAG: 50S ribosomal protein L18 [Gammaproteobacteria bacterium]|nr:50S ribosomal protein L18 [Gammaproteobacteria bacterium]